MKTCSGRVIILFCKFAQRTFNIWFSLTANNEAFRPSRISVYKALLLSTGTKESKLVLSALKIFSSRELLCGNKQIQKYVYSANFTLKQGNMTPNTVDFV